MLSGTSIKANTLRHCPCPLIALPFSFSQEAELVSALALASLSHDPATLPGGGPAQSLAWALSWVAPRGPNPLALHDPLARQHWSAAAGEGPARPPDETINLLPSRSAQQLCAGERSAHERRQRSHSEPNDEKRAATIKREAPLFCFALPEFFYRKVREALAANLHCQGAKAERGSWRRIMISRLMR